MRQLTGLPQVVRCSGCQQEFTAGSLPHVSASGRLLDIVYEDQGLYYCEQCAAKVSEAVDTTRSVTQFYADTTGETVQ